MGEGRHTPYSTCKLEVGRPPLSVFIAERSWMIFHYASVYLRLTYAWPDHPEDAATPIAADMLVWLQEHPFFWPEYDEFVRLKKWIDEL